MFLSLFLLSGVAAVRRGRKQPRLGNFPGKVVSVHRSMRDALFHK